MAIFQIWKKNEINKFYSLFSFMQKIMTISSNACNMTKPSDNDKTWQEVIQIRRKQDLEIYTPMLVLLLVLEVIYTLIL